MKLVLEQPTYSLYNKQERIEFFHKNHLLKNQGKINKI